MHHAQRSTTVGAGLCVLTSDVPENREVVDGAGFTFQRGNSTDLADRLRFLIANPALRDAAGRAAKEKIREHYQWPKIAADIEKAYLDMMGWSLAEPRARKPCMSVVPAVPDNETATERQAV